MTRSFPSREKLLKRLASMTAPEKAEALVAECLVYGPVMPVCARCGHPLCECCYGNANTCDLCNGVPTPCGSVDLTSELSDLNINRVCNVLSLAYKKIHWEAGVPIAIESFEDGWIYILTDQPDDGAVTLPSTQPGFVWEEAYHSGCYNECLVVIPGGFDAEISKWHKSHEKMDGETSFTDERGHLVGSTEGHLTKIAAALGLESEQDLFAGWEDGP